MLHIGERSINVLRMRPSFGKIREGAEKGNSTDQYELGRMYSMGYAVPQDYSKAIEWYRKSADQGNSSGQNGLGFLYANGRGVERNYSEALKWYFEAAGQGNAKSEFNIGNMYYNGWGVSKDRVAAFHWYNLAAAQGDEEAQRVLGARWSGHDIGSRFALPLISLVTMLYLAEAISRRQSILTGQYSGISRTYFVGTTYLFVTVYCLPYFGMDRNLFLDHIIFFATNAVMGIYAAQLIYLVSRYNRKARLVVVCLGTIGAVLSGYTVYLGANHDSSGSWAPLQMCCLVSGLLLGLIIPVGRRVGGWPRSREPFPGH
jgi:hypothetical protein